MKGPRHRQYKIGIDGRKHGRAITAKRALRVDPRGTAPFCCPMCFTNLRKNLIRLRPDLFECRLCDQAFIREGIPDDYDFDFSYEDTK